MSRESKKRFGRASWRANTQMFLFRARNTVTKYCGSPLRFDPFPGSKRPALVYIGTLKEKLLNCKLFTTKRKTLSLMMNV